jgi:hypothetical protein
LRVAWPSTSASSMFVQICYGWPLSAPLLVYFSCSSSFSASSMLFCYMGFLS